MFVCNFFLEQCRIVFADCFPTSTASPYCLGVLEGVFVSESLFLRRSRGDLGLAFPPPGGLSASCGGEML